MASAGDMFGMNALYPALWNAISAPRYHQAFFNVNVPPPDRDEPLPHVPTSVCSSTESSWPFPDHGPRCQSNRIEMPVTAVSDTAGFPGSAPDTVVVFWVIAPPVIVPLLGFAAPAGHSYVPVTPLVVAVRLI